MTEPLSESERRRVSGRRREDAALDQATFAEAFVALTDGIVLTDGEGHVASANPAAFRVLGEDALIGQVFEELLLVSGATRIQDTEGHLVRRAWFPREERMGVLEIVTTPLPGGRALHTVRDVTAQAELLRLKEDFLMEVAHELRTPISALIASLDLVVEDALTMPRQELSVLAGTLRRSGLRLDHLVENLMDAGSIEAGTFQVRAMPASLRHSLSEALAFVHPMLESKGQELATELAPDADRVQADVRRTTQVFANLISNASKYAPEGTKVTVRAHHHRRRRTGHPARRAEAAFSAILPLPDRARAGRRARARPLHLPRHRPRTGGRYRHREHPRSRHIGTLHTSKGSPLG